MAGPCICPRPWQNPPPIKEDKLAISALGVALTDNSGTVCYIPAVSRAPTPALVLLPTLALFMIWYTDKDL